VFPSGQSELAISQASYLGSKAVYFRLNGRLYEVCRNWLLGGRVHGRRWLFWRRYRRISNASSAAFFVSNR
jgi:hypothetical protein